MSFPIQVVRGLYEYLPGSIQDTNLVTTRRYWLKLKAAARQMHAPFGASHYPCQRAQHSPRLSIRVVAARVLSLRPRSALHELNLVLVQTSNYIPVSQSQEYMSGPGISRVSFGNNVLGLGGLRERDAAATVSDVNTTRISQAVFLRSSC